MTVTAQLSPTSPTVTVRPSVAMSLARAWSRRARLTPQGVIYMFATAGVGLVAYRTGNNLIFALFSLMVTSMVLSRCHLWSTTRRLKVMRSLGDEIFAGLSTTVRLRVINPNRFFAAWALTINDLESIPLFPDEPAPFIPRLGPGEEVRLSWRVRFRRRGHYTAGNAQLSSGFPFGFFRRSHAVTAEASFFVLPRPRPLPLPRAVVPSDLDPRFFGRRPTHRIGEENEFRGLREYRPGDPFRKIHWKTSARARTLMVSELETASRHRVTLVLDNTTEPERSRLRRSVGLERGVRVAASLAAELDRRGVLYRFGAMENGCASLLPFGQGPAHLRTVLEKLAILDSCPDARAADLLHLACHGSGPDTGIIVLVLSEKHARSVHGILEPSRTGSIRIHDVSRPDLLRLEGRP